MKYFILSNLRQELQKPVKRERVDVFFMVAFIYVRILCGPLGMKNIPVTKAMKGRESPILS